jgi:hypothetical protein
MGSGSKKGERRGNARKRLSQADPAISKDASRSPHRFTEDYMRQIVMVVNKGGPGMLPPRELIKYAQDYFHDEALHLQKMLALVRARVDITPPEDIAANEQLSREIVALKQEIRDALVTSADMAFKNLPYFHAKVSPAENIQREIADSPLEILKMLFQEIEELGRGRPTWMQGRPQLKLLNGKGGNGQGQG